MPELVPTILLTAEQIEAILDYLFTNGMGQKADRLVLVDANGRDLGGWCRGAVRDVLISAAH